MEAKEETQYKEAAQSLRAAIVDAQGIIRSYDTKAQVVGAFVGVAVATIKLAAPSHQSCGFRLVGVLAIAFAAVTFALLGFVLYPRTKERGQLNLGGYDPQYTFFPHEANSQAVNVKEFSKRALNTDWVSELNFELFKLVRIRADKCFWLSRAMKSAIASIFLSFAAMVIALWSAQ